MELVQSRIVTGDVAALAAFYARLLGVDAALNDYYVEVPAGPATVGFSKCRFTEYCCGRGEHGDEVRTPLAGETILDFRVDDVDREFERIDSLGVEWVLRPTTQPWGSRAMIFRDPDGNLVNVFSRLPDGETRAAAGGCGG
jgi:catechol 2,3-dioxygenase-like lactoylglutathione lyase family enzyme